MSDEHLFLVAIDMTDPRVDWENLVRLMRSRSLIKAFWNYIPGCFLVSTDLTSDELATEIVKITHDALLLVVAVDPATAEGWLPTQGWRWIEKRAKKPEPVDAE